MLSDFSFLLQVNKNLSMTSPPPGPTKKQRVKQSFVLTTDEIIHQFGFPQTGEQLPALHICLNVQCYFLMNVLISIQK